MGYLCSLFNALCRKTHKVRCSTTNTIKTLLQHRRHPSYHPQCAHPPLTPFGVRIYIYKFMNKLCLTPPPDDLSAQMWIIKPQAIHSSTHFPLKLIINYISGNKRVQHSATSAEAPARQFTIAAPPLSIYIYRDDKYELLPRVL